MRIQITLSHLLFTYLDNVVTKDALIDVSSTMEYIDSVIVSFNQNR